MFISDAAAIKVSQKLLRTKDVILLCTGNHLSARSVPQTI